MFAQSLIEYGSLSSITAAVQSALFFFQRKAGEVTQTTWVGLGVIALLVFLLWGRRSPRF